MGHRIYPFLRKSLEIKGPNQAWCSDITYIPLQLGFMYLVSADTLTTMAAVDRLVHHSIILEFSGESLRASREKEKIGG